MRSRTLAVRLAALASLLAPADALRAQTYLTRSFESLETDDSTALAWADIDGDGDLDLAVANCCAAPLRLYRNAAGVLALDWSSPELLDATSLAWGDLDGDLDLDLAVGSIGAVLLYRNDALGLSLAWTSAEADSVRALAWADHDRDGDLDLAVGSGPAEPNRLYRNDAGTLVLEWTSSELDDTRALAWADFDRDGFLDLAIGNFAEPNRLYRNSGGVLGLLWSSPESDRTTSIAWADADADLDLDLAAGNDGEPLRLYASDAGTLTLSWSSVESPRVAALAWSAGALWGSLHLVAGGGAGEPLRAWIAFPAGGSSAAYWSSLETDELRGLALGDVDGDLVPEIGVATAAGVPLRLYAHSPFDFARIAEEPQSPYHANAVAWGDFDGDRDLDYATSGYFTADPSGTQSGRPVRVFRNDAGAFNLVWTSPETPFSRGLAWGDWDRDGDLDLAVGSIRAEPVRVYRNDLSSFTLAWESVEVDGSMGVAWGDVDGDGQLDLVVVSLRDAPLRVYRNLGGAMLPAAVSSDPRGGGQAALADIDGDLDLDLAVTGPNWRTGRYLELYLNDCGEFTLEWSEAMVAPPIFASDLAWGDLDGDGDPDLAVCYQNGATDLKVFENVGGALIESFARPVTGVAAGVGVSFADLDSDGRLDLLFVDFGGMSLLRNLGGTLAPARAMFSEGDSPHEVAPGDADGDGDIDLAVAYGDSPGFGSTRVLFNERLGTTPSGLPDTPARPVAVERPGLTQAAYLHSTAEALGSPVLLSYRLVDPEGEDVPKLEVEWAPAAGGAWRTASEAAGGDGRFGLASSPWPGTSHVFAWDAAADAALGVDLVLRVSVPSQIPSRLSQSIALPRLAAVSPPFRILPPPGQAGPVQLAKSVVPVGPVLPGELLTFTLQVGNPGTADAAPVDVTDTLDDLNLANPSALDCPAPGVGTIDRTGPRPVLRCAGLSVAAGGSVDIRFTAEVARPYRGPATRVCNEGLARFGCALASPAPVCVDVTPRYPPPTLTKSTDGFDDANGNGAVDPGEGIWFKLRLCSGSPSDDFPDTLTLFDTLAAGTSGVADRLFSTRGTAVATAGGFEVQGIALEHDPDPARSCADVSFRTFVAAGLPNGARVCNLAATLWTDPATGSPRTIYSNGDDPLSPTACFTIGVPCSTGALTRRSGLRAVKSGSGARFEWDRDPAAAEHHVNSVAAKADLVPPGPLRPPVPGAVALAQCEVNAPGASCTDPDALGSPEPILFYQVVSACTPSGLDEGPAN